MGWHHVLDTILYCKFLNQIRSNWIFVFDSIFNSYSKFWGYSIWFLIRVKFYICPILTTPTPHAPPPPPPPPPPPRNYWDKDKQENDPTSQRKQLVAPPTGPALRFKNGFPFFSQRMLSVERPVAGHLKLTLPLTAQSFDRTGRFVCQAGAGDTTTTYVTTVSSLYTNTPHSLLMTLAVHVDSLGVLVNMEYVHKVCLSWFKSEMFFK